MNAKEGKQLHKTRGRRARKSKRNDDDDGGNANASRESKFAAAPEYSSLLNNNKSNELVVPPASNERNIANVPLRATFLCRGRRFENLRERKKFVGVCGWRESVPDRRWDTGTRV